MAATSMNRAGKLRDMAARAMVTLPSSKRLAHDLENIAREFGQLVEEQHAVMGQRDFAGPRNHPSTDQAGVGNGVMRRTEGARADRVRWMSRARRQRCGSSWFPGPLRT